jgi:hypothetical protein
MIEQSEMSDMNERLPMRILVDVSVSPQNMKKIRQHSQID